MQTKTVLILVVLGLILLLLITGCGGGNVLTGSSAAIPVNRTHEIYQWDNLSPAGGEDSNLVTGSVK